MKKLWTGLRIFLWMTFVTGIVYPLVITGIAQMTMKRMASGDFIIVEGKPAGATLIAQKFQSDKYFWARPSSIDYNPLPSGGSNLGPTSAALKKIVDERKAVISKAHNLSANDKIPSELLFSSGSGLDPHISLPAANFQIDRVAKARRMSEDMISKLVQKFTIKRRLSFLGEPMINVLKLNLALDELEENLRKKI